ncbi:CBS domain-containing protein [Hahella sp. KA22]|uniref:HlyC/CorC family transporter n=1 Tax=Hahella sp. KA22 TaxID=1628392 RepID=UPI000FDD7C92|nr:transporter associated domain-containing protein [Hahella sp. KA22]AZZ90828.1 CBS domain-containing protein [Hahella sp. KA22]QAY54198.1 CBS domain-containing protein [Hahella sp. KA22]
MSDDHSGSQQISRSWLDRITQAFSDEPQNKEELLQIMREAENRNIIDPDSLSLIEGAMQVTDMQVREIMIPRAQMSVVKASQSPQEYMDELLESAHSRYPVIGESKDEVVGILLAKDLLGLALKNELNKSKVQDILRPVWFIPESKRLNQLLKEFKENRNHMAIVVDEYGGVAGLVTIEDVLEQIVGEIEDEHDFDEESLIKCTGHNQYVVKALTPVEEFNEYFTTKLDEEEFDTIGGLVIKQFGRLPKRGETVSFNGFDIKILNADSRQIRLIQVSRTA